MAPKKEPLDDLLKQRQDLQAECLKLHRLKPLMARGVEPMPDFEAKVVAAEREYEKVKKQIISRLPEFLTSDESGWVRFGELEITLADMGITVSRSPCEGSDYGTYHATYSKDDGRAFELIANYWAAASFAPLIEWVERN